MRADDIDGDTIDKCEPAAQTVSDDEFIDDGIQIDGNLELIIMPLLIYVEVSRIQCRTLFLSRIAVNLSIR